MRSLSELDPDVRIMAEDLLASALSHGIELVVTQTYRTAEEQAALYAQGRTKVGIVVTNSPPGYSWHEFRRAFDVAIKKWAGDITPLNYYDGPWSEVGDLGEQVGLDWGGRWKHPDMPHFEHHGGKTLGQRRAERIQGADNGRVVERPEAMDHGAGGGGAVGGSVVAGGGAREQVAGSR